MPTPDTLTPDTVVPEVVTPDTVVPDAIPDVAVPDTAAPGSITLPLVRPNASTELEPRYRVLIHNDDVTTFNYVIFILSSIFLLSEELADHIAWVAHDTGAAIVVVRPRSEAETLAKAASNRARMDGYPLTFSTEEQE